MNTAASIAPGRSVSRFEPERAAIGESTGESLPGAGNRANLFGRRKGGAVEQSGEYRITADRATVWAALNDPQVLARCIDGCQTMTQPEPGRFDAKVKARVGPVSATFDAQLTLEDVVPSEGYTIKANVKGGPAGFARGTARVGLADAGADTVLNYRVDASIGGKLAQVGSRLIDGAARKMADDFFARFRSEVGAPEPLPDDDARAAAPAGRESGGRWIIWLAAFAALLLAILFAL
jgi:carbon monoxide dehydrogenase subunit G